MFPCAEFNGEEVVTIIAPYGTWQSPITAELVTAAQVGLGQPALDRGAVYWTRGAAAGGRPHRAGAPGPGRARRCDAGGLQRPHARPRIWRRRLAGQGRRGGRGRFRRSAALSAGGRSGAARADAGERPQAALRRSRAGSRPAPHPRGARGSPWRRRGGEQHRRRRPRRRGPRPGAGRGPRLLQLAAPQPRWPTARLAELGPPRHALGQHHAVALPRSATDGGLAQVRQVAGGERESIVQPDWSPDGQLYFVSDRTGWWNIYRACRRRPGACLPDVCRICRAGLDVRQPLVWFPRSRNDPRLLQPGRHLAARAPRRRRRQAQPARSVLQLVRRHRDRWRPRGAARRRRPTGRRRSSSSIRRAGWRRELCTAGEVPVDAGLSRAPGADHRSRAAAQWRMPSTIRRPIRSSGHRRASGRR